MEEKKKKPIYKRWWFWVVIVIFVSVMITKGTNIENASTTPNNSSTTKEKEQPQEQKEIYALNEEAELKGASITVTNVERTKGDTWSTPKEGNEYVIVTVQIRNTGDKNIRYNPFDYKIQTGSGTIESQTFTIIDSDTSLTSGELAPGGTKSGTISFEAPIGDENLTLIYEGSFWSSSQLKFALQ